MVYYRLGFDAHIIHLFHYKMFKLGEKSVKQTEKNNHSRTIQDLIPYFKSTAKLLIQVTITSHWIITIGIKPSSLNLINVFLQSVLHPGVSDSFKL